MFVRSLLLIFSPLQPETARISDVAHFLFVRKKVPTSMWPMVPWNGALLTVHSLATQAPKWDWHPRDQIRGSPGHWRESGITQYLGAEMSIAAQGSASDPHPLCAQLKKKNRNEPRHQGGKSCKHNTLRAHKFPASAVQKCISHFFGS